MEGLYGMSLDLLAELLTQWRDLWSTVRTTMDRLPPEALDELRALPSDPQAGLLAAVDQFARSVHPDVVDYLESHLDAAASMVEHLADEEVRGGIRFSGDGAGLESRIRRLESLIGGVGAVLRTLGEVPVDQDPPD